jgi:poly(A)-specific ribonuclease
MLPNTNFQEQMLAQTVDRTVGFSCSTFNFLQDHGFSFDQALSKGVTYLSRKEAAQAVQGNKSDFLSVSGMEANDLEVHHADLDEEAKAFYQSTQERLLAYREISMPTSDDVLNVDNPNGGRVNHLQMRTVQHLIHVHLPGYRAVYKNKKNFIQVRRADVEADQRALRNKLLERREAVRRITGFRYVVEALSGGDFAGALEAEWLLSDEGMDTEARAKGVERMQEDIAKWQRKLRAASPVLVGHNLFFDLCFMYQTFVGDLPEESDAFRARIHQLFPRIVDTKYMATRIEHSMMPDMSLAELYYSLALKRKPAISSVPNFFRRKGSAHQAGYDSESTEWNARFPEFACG